MTLDLPIRNFVSREDLIEAPANSLAIELLDAWPDWPGLILILTGPAGSGKSHIARIWAQKSNARCIFMNQLDTLNEDKANLRPLLLEDAHASSMDEMELFHILNAKRAQKAAIMITSRKSFPDWQIDLEDLNSRLRTAQRAEIGEPDDELLRKVLYKLFADRQLLIEANMIDYLVARMERSLESANNIVEMLDLMGLTRHRKITRRLAGEALSLVGQ